MPVGRVKDGGGGEEREIGEGDLKEKEVRSGWRSIRVKEGVRRQKGKEIRKVVLHSRNFSALEGQPLREKGVDRRKTREKVDEEKEESGGWSRLVERVGEGKENRGRKFK